MPTSTKQGSLQYVNGTDTKQIDRVPFFLRFNLLKNEAIKFYPSWKDIRDYCCPTRGFFQDEVPNRGTMVDHQKVIDSHAQKCGRDAASGMISAHTTPSRPWFKLETDDEDLNKYQPVQAWLEDTVERVRRVMAYSNIYDVYFSAYEELIHFGTAAGMITEDYNDVIRARAYTIGEYYLGSGYDCRVNVFARWYWMTVGQLVQEFGYENCTTQTQASYDRHYLEQWRKITHMIEPNDKRIPGYSDFNNMPYRSIQWEDGSPQNMYLRTSGYEEFPVFAPRWNTKTTADIYGTSPGWTSLGNVKMLQKEQREKLMALAKVVNPPMQHDSSVQGDVHTVPGGITIFSAQLPNAGLKPAYQINPDINAIREDILEVKKQISDDYYADLFRLMIEIDRTGVTATEIAEKQSERIGLISPFVEKTNNEMLSPSIERIFMIMFRKNLFLPLPKELQGVNLRIKYISIFAQAQRMLGINTIAQSTQFIDSQMMVDPGASDVFNRDEMNRSYLTMIGAPVKGIRKPEEVESIRKQRAKAQQQAQQAAVMQASADAAAKGGKAVKDMGTTPMGENSALDQFLAKNVPQGAAQ